MNVIELLLHQIVIYGAFHLYLADFRDRARTQPSFVWIAGKREIHELNVIECREACREGYLQTLQANGI